MATDTLYLINYAFKNSCNRTNHIRNWIWEAQVILYMI